MEIRRKRCSAKKQCNFDSGWLEQQQGGLLNLVKLRGLLGVGTKLNESMFKNKQINSAVTPEHEFC